MVKKYVNLLKHQIDKLSDESFDLEAWKKATVILVARIFGDASTKIEEIQSISFDYGSWSLRDASGSKDQMDSCKNQGRVILEACIAELEIVGLEKSETKARSEDPLIECIEEELKMSEYRGLLEILKTKSNRKDKITMLIQKLESYDTKVSPKIVANLMTHPAHKKLFV